MERKRAFLPTAQGKWWFDMVTTNSIKNNKSTMTASQKIMMRDFHQRFFELMEKYWNPADSDKYWDDLTEDAMKLIGQFQSSNKIQNGFLSNVVVAFLNSREELTL